MKSPQDAEFCTGSCEHLRSFRTGFDNRRRLGPFNIRDRQATCALKPEMTLHMMAYPRCWREAENLTGGEVC